MAGVINVITKKPVKGTPVKGNVYGSMGNRYRDYGLNVSSAVFTIGGKKSFTKDFSDLQGPF